MASGGQQDPERGCGRPPTLKAEVTAAGMFRQTFVLGLAFTFATTIVGQLSKRLVVHRTTPFRVSTTFPVFCPVSTYLVASTTSSSGYVRSMTARYFPASISSLRKRTSFFV